MTNIIETFTIILTIIISTLIIIWFIGKKDDFLDINYNNIVLSSTMSKKSNEYNSTSFSSNRRNNIRPYDFIISTADRCWCHLLLRWWVQDDKALSRIAESFTDLVHKLRTV